MLNQRKLNHRLTLILVFCLSLITYTNAAKADCVSEAVSCVVNVAKAQYYAVSSVGPVLEFTFTHPVCVSAIVGQDYVSLGVMGAITGLSAAGLIGSSETGCHSDLYGKYAGQLAGALSSIVPNDQLKAIAKGELESSAVALALGAVPVPATTIGLQNLKGQIDCGCAVASTGAGALEKIKQALNATAAAASKCTGALGCFGKGLQEGFLAAGKAFVAVGECVGGPNDCGESAPMPESEYYKVYFQPFVATFVQWRIDGKPFSNGAQMVTGEKQLGHMHTVCESYYIDHRYSGGALSFQNHAQEACNRMRESQFRPEADALLNSRMDNEIYPKKIVTLASDLKSKYAKSCEIPSKHVQPKAEPGTIVVDANSPGVETFGGQELAYSEDCKKQMNQIIGLTPESGITQQLNVVSAQPGSLAAEVKDTYKAGGLSVASIENTFNKLVSSKYEVRLKDVANVKKAQIVVLGQQNEKTVLINKAYDKFARLKWDEYRAKCPKKNDSSISVDFIARPICLKNTADYLGMTIEKINDTNPNDDFGSLDFNALKNMPIVYKLAKESFEKQGAAATQDLADGRVQLAFAFKAGELDAIASSAIAKAKDQLAPIRLKQEQAYQDRINKNTDSYADAIKCDLSLADAAEYSSCKYSLATLDAMFSEWKKQFQWLSNRKAELDKTVEKGIPFSDKPTDEYALLLVAIDNATKGSKEVYGTLKKQPNAVIKEKRNTQIKSTLDHSKVNEVDKLNKDKKAETLDNSGLKVDDSTPTLKDQSKGSNLPKGFNKLAGDGSARPEPDAKPQVRGMRAAPGMIVATNDKYKESKSGGLNSNSLKPNAEPGSQDGKPAAVTSLEESQNALKNRVGSQGIKDETPSRLGAGFDLAKPAAPGAVLMPRAIGLPATANASDAAQQATQGGRLSHGVSVAANQPPSANPAAPGAVLMPRTIGLPATANAGNAAQQNTQGGRLSPGVSIAANSPPSAALPPITGMTKPADNVGLGNLNNTRGLAAMPVGNVGNGVAVSAATNAGISRAPVGMPSPSAPPPVRNIANNTPLAPSAPPVAAFDRQQYQRVARQNLEAKWVPQCKNEPCKSEISALVVKRINEVLRMLDTGTDLRNNGILVATEAKMDATYNPQMQARIDASVPKAVDNTPVTAPPSTAPVEGVKNINSIKKRNF